MELFFIKNPLAIDVGVQMIGDATLVNQGPTGAVVEQGPQHIGICLSAKRAIGPATSNKTAPIDLYGDFILQVGSTVLPYILTPNNFGRFLYENPSLKLTTEPDPENINKIILKNLDKASEQQVSFYLVSEAATMLAGNDFTALDALGKAFGVSLLPDNDISCIGASGHAGVLVVNNESPFKGVVTILPGFGEDGDPIKINFDTPDSKTFFGTLSDNGIEVVILKEYGASNVISCVGATDRLYWGNGVILQGAYTVVVRWSDGDDPVIVHTAEASGTAGTEEELWQSLDFVLRNQLSVDLGQIGINVHGDGDLDIQVASDEANDESVNKTLINVRVSVTSDKPIINRPSITDVISDAVFLSDNKQELNFCLVPNPIHKINCLGEDSFVDFSNTLEFIGKYQIDFTLTQETPDGVMFETRTVQDELFTHKYLNAIALEDNWPSEWVTIGGDGNTLINSIVPASNIRVRMRAETINGLFNVDTMGSSVNQYLDEQDWQIVEFCLAKSGIGQISCAGAVDKAITGLINQGEKFQYYIDGSPVSFIRPELVNITYDPENRSVIWYNLSEFEVRIGMEDAIFDLNDSGWTMNENSTVMYDLENRTVTMCLAPNQPK